MSYFNLIQCSQKALDFETVETHLNPPLGIYITTLSKEHGQHRLLQQSQKKALIHPCLS